MSLNDETQKLIRYILSGDEKKLLKIDPFEHLEYLKELSGYWQSNYLDIVLYYHNENHYINDYRKYLKDGDIEFLEKAMNYGFIPAIKKFILLFEKDNINLLLKYSSINDADILEKIGDYYFDDDPQESLKYYLRIKNKSKNVNFKIGLLYYLNNNDQCKNYLENSDKIEIICVLLYEKYKNYDYLTNCFKYYPDKYREEYCYRKYNNYYGDPYNDFTENDAKTSAKLSYLLGRKYYENDYEKAFYWFSLFDTFYDSIYFLSKMYLYGKYVKKNLKKSLELCKKLYLNDIFCGSLFNEILYSYDPNIKETISIDVINTYLEILPDESNYFQIKHNGIRYEIIEEKLFFDDDIFIQYTLINDNNFRILKEVNEGELFIYNGIKYACENDFQDNNNEDESESDEEESESESDDE